jgi:hypothetical protein
MPRIKLMMCVGRNHTSWHRIDSGS